MDEGGNITKMFTPKSNHLTQRTVGYTFRIILPLAGFEPETVEILKAVSETSQNCPTPSAAAQVSKLT